MGYGLPDYDEISENGSDRDDNSEGSYDLGEEQDEEEVEEEEEEGEDEEDEGDEPEPEDEEDQFNFDFGDDISDTEIPPVILDDEDDAPMSPISW